MSSCPGEETLRLLGADVLGDETYAAIEQHVEACPQCKAVLERLADRHPDPTVILPGPERLPRITGFEIRSELDRGGMGVVYLATEKGLDRLVALKILPAAVGPDASTGPRRRWLREARAVSSVRHPNVVPLYDFGEADGWFFLVLEYIPGGTLKKRLTEPLPPRVAAGLVETIARAVGYLHSRGLLHLDLKPSNILLDCEENAPWDQVTPRISDFGLALSSDGAGASDTSLAGIRGTPSYMAPEQAAGARAGVGEAADFHALGAILYELLTGRPPFQGSSTLETLDQVRGQNPVPPRRLNPKIPRDLETIALKCLEKNPSRRYASAEALADDLTYFLEGRPIKARSVSAIEHAGRWCRRRPAIATLATALLMTFSVGFLAIVLLWRHAEAERNEAELARGRAEAARIRAEADYRAARAGLTTVVGLGSWALNLEGRGLETRELPTEYFIRCLEVARYHLIELAKPPSSDPEIWKFLALVDLILGKALDFRGKPVEARPLHVEAVMYWEKILHVNPHDLFAKRHRWESLIHLAKVAEQQGNSEESVRYWERAISLGESLMPFRNDREFVELAECRFSLARLVDRLGDHERARTILEANLRMRGNVSADTKPATVRALELRTREQLRRLMEQFPPQEFEGLAAEDWARKVAAVLSSTRSTVSTDPTLESESGSRFIQSLSERAGSERRTSKLDDARRTADRIHALAKLMVARYPDQPAAHLSLAAAFQQRAKNAWRFDDRGAVKRYLELALDEARQALVLDPQNARADGDVTELQRRLNDLLAPQRDAESPIGRSGQL
jgi:eukaryotic-like serine/threonine-protein kinase